MLINLVWYEPAFMLELHTKSLPVTSGVVFTNEHAHQLSAVVCGGTSFHAKTTHQDSVWLLLAAMHIPVNLGVVSTKQHAHQLGAVASTAHPIFMRFPPSCYFKIGFYQ